jgi:histone H2A
LIFETTGTNQMSVAISSIGNAGRGKTGAGKRISRTNRAGLVFSVSRVARFMRKGRPNGRVGGGAPVYLAGVAEYLVAEILELAGNVARDNKRSRIVPRHIQLAVRTDRELSELLCDATIAQGGVVPLAHGALADKIKVKKVGKTGKKAKVAKSAKLVKTAKKPGKRAASAKTKTTDAAVNAASPPPASAPTA